MKQILRRLTNIENLLYSFIENQSKADDYKEADINGCRQVEAQQENRIKKNTESIEENSDAILETYEGNIETAETVAALEDAVLEVYELLVESEE